MISFVGAGPGDPDLISVKGRRLLEEADMVIYTGSLVSVDHLNWCKSTCVKHDSKRLNLDEVMDLIEEGHSKGWDIVRLHTGDPSIYGAIREQMDRLEDLGIRDYQVIPGISSFSAAAASIKKELTLPGVSQTVILTRNAGRTPVPEDEDLVHLAKTGATLCIFLSVQNIDGVVQKLSQGYGRTDVPVAVVYKASWPDEQVLYGTLADISSKVKEAGIQKMSQILVGDFLGDDYDLSKLYDKDFYHKFRN